MAKLNLFFHTIVFFCTFRKNFSGYGTFEELKENYHTNLKGILPSIDYLRYIERTLKEIYQAGIVSTENIQQLHKDSTSSVMVIDDKLANPQATENLYTVKKAYEHLLSADSTHFNREILRQCSLNEYITPNLTFDEERTQAAKEEILNNYSWANGLVVSGGKSSARIPIISWSHYAKNPSNGMSPWDRTV